MSNVDCVVDVSLTESQTHADLRKLSSRKLGDPSDIPLMREGSVGEGALPASRHPGIYVAGKSDRFHVHRLFFAVTK